MTGNPSAALLQQLYDAQARQRSLQNQIAGTSDQLEEAERAVDDAKAALHSARAARDRAQRGLRDSVVTIYKCGAPYGLYRVLRAAPDTGILRDGTGGQLSGVTAATVRIDELSDQLSRAVDARDTLLVKLADLKDLLRQADETVKRLLNRTSDNLTGVPAPGAPPGPAAAPGAGGLLPPVRGKLTSGYGNRHDPYYQTWQLHAGIDLAAPAGTPVHAADAGQVVQAGWNGGYGNYICIAHGQVQGQRMTTCYGHLSRILVQPGQDVRQGQVIGQVGSTGASTGPHLHFEVRLGGRPTDPQLWL